MSESRHIESTGDWRHRAACLDEDPELFFPVGSTTRWDQMQTEQAKSVCTGCDVRERCLQWALESKQDYGVWGGLSEGERRDLKRRMGRRANV